MSEVDEPLDLPVGIPTSGKPEASSDTSYNYPCVTPLLFGTRVDLEDEEGVAHRVVVA